MSRKALPRRQVVQVHRRKRKPTEVQLNCDIERSTMDLIDRFCNKTGTKRKALIELAVLKYLNPRMSP